MKIYQLKCIFNPRNNLCYYYVGDILNYLNFNFYLINAQKTGLQEE